MPMNSPSRAGGLSSTIIVRAAVQVLPRAIPATGAITHWKITLSVMNIAARKTPTHITRLIARDHLAVSRSVTKPKSHDPSTAVTIAGPSTVSGELNPITSTA